MIVRKCKKNEIEKIVEVANKSFQQDREAGFSFKKSKPVIYSNKNRDYSNIHFVIEDKKGEFLGVIGNWSMK